MDAGAATFRLHIMVCNRKDLARSLDLASAYGQLIKRVTGALMQHQVIGIKKMLALDFCNLMAIPDLVQQRPWHFILFHSAPPIPAPGFLSDQSAYPLMLCSSTVIALK